MSPSSHHAALVDLFVEFRESLKPKLVDVTTGVPDFTESEMARRRDELQQFRSRLDAFDAENWNVDQRVDYHVVRAEMNAVAFDHRVLEPWARDPGFYNLTDGIYPRLLVHHSRSTSDWGLVDPEFPLDENGVADYRKRLRVVPGLLDQARKNLTKAAGELATIAIRVKEKDIELLERQRKRLTEHHGGLPPDLLRDLLGDLDAAISATETYRDWLSDRQPTMTAPAGIGKDNYDWWMRHVHLIPYRWNELHAMIQAEYDRAIACLKLTEHKNRKLAEFELTSSESENHQRQRDAAEKLMRFLRDEEIITVPEDLAPLPPEQYPRVWGVSAYLRENDRGFFEETNDREPMTNVLHVFFGHYYTAGRKIWYQEKDDRVIRGAVRLYDMHEARSEALAFGIEEWMMEASLFDDRPRSKEITYIWSAFRAIRALTDLKMHAGEMSLQDGLRNISGGIPYPWAEPDSDAVWWDAEETLRAPGHSTNYVVGRNMMQGLMAERSRQLGDDFSIRRFFDEFMDGGIVPISLTRWELTGEQPPTEVSPEPD